VEKKVAHLQNILKSCTLCPRKCRVDRTTGERGFCDLADDLVVKKALPHFGEEPPLSGTHGAGTIFLSSCNLRCSYCQNWQISNGTVGERMDSETLAGMMLALQDQHCHNIEPVTPTPQLPGIMKALTIARQKGLNLPLVYNCSGYENPDVLRLIEGMVDIYLPDFKYGNEQASLRLSGLKDYPEMAGASIREMFRQVGEMQEDEQGVAERGLIIRHLVLPGNTENSFDVLKLIKANVSTSVPLSIMSQYTPVPSVEGHPDLGRRITHEEYESVVNSALDMGFETIFTQEVDESTLLPDFDKDAPFHWPPL
jgi:putative pyruvate formate lyase activating enzyme